MIRLQACLITTDICIFAYLYNYKAQEPNTRSLEVQSSNNTSWVYESAIVGLCILLLGTFFSQSTAAWHMILGSQDTAILLTKNVIEY